MPWPSECSQPRSISDITPVPSILLNRRTLEVVSELAMIYFIVDVCSDICHELMGHVPLFCDPCFAQFSQVFKLIFSVYMNRKFCAPCNHLKKINASNSPPPPPYEECSYLSSCDIIITLQEIGLASLGISDEWIQKLSSVRVLGGGMCGQ